MTSLKGIVNMTEPRMFVYDGDAYAEGPYSWLNSLGLDYVEYSDYWELVTKYKNEVEGLIVYDPNQIHTVSLATTLAKEKKALIVSPSLLAKLTSEPYNFPILLDLRGKFNSKLEVYQELYDTYWPSIDHRLLIGLHPDYHQGSLREYAIGVGAAVIWLDPKVNAESQLLNSFLASMPDGANYMGWWPEEGPGVERASNYGIPTIASDYCSNLTVHSGMSRQINVKPIPPKPALENKIYVAFIISDGDNLQYVEHLMKKIWENPDRGSVPIGWTVSPAMVDAMPGALNYFHESATENDNLISGPSGYGYSYPNFFSNQNELNQFVKKTEEYNKKAGLYVTTIWNTITGGIDLDVGQAFAEYAPSTLGLTAQNTGGPISIYNESLPGKPLTCNYCSNEENMLTHIGYGTQGWDGNSPRFLIIQSNPWNNATPTTFKNIVASLNTDYVVVRPDHIFELMREANDLPINPTKLYGNGEGLIGNYYNGMNFETPVAERKDSTINFDWRLGSPMTGVNADNFSVKWTGEIQPLYSETYTFYVTSDDGVKLTIDGNVLIDELANIGKATRNGTLTLKSGKKYDIKLEYAEGTENASCALEWQSTSQVREIIPQIQLYPESSSTINSTTGLVTAYVDSGFTGFSTALKVGEYTLADLNSVGIFDKDIASLKVSEGYKVVIYNQDNFKGNLVEITEDTSDLGAWKDSAISLKVKVNGDTDLSGTYILQNRGSNYYMDVTGGTGATGNGSNIQQYLLTSRTNQQFKFTHLGDGAYQILAVNSNKSIEIGGRNLSDGANVNQWSYLGQSHQKFVLLPTGDGYYKIMAQHSGEILEAENTNVEGNIRQMPDNNQTSGQWKLIPAPLGKVGTGTGLKGDYFNGRNFETLKYTTIDGTINFNWDSNSPNPSVNQDNFSVIWTGLIQPKFTGNYTFYVNSDNGRRLWINNQLIIDKWIDDYGIEYSGDIQLTEGQKYNIKLEYFEAVGGANCKLEWVSEYHGKEVIPKSQLYPDQTAGVFDYKIAQLDIFPNPTNNFWTVKTKNIKMYSVKVFDVLGNKVLTLIPNSTEVKISRADLKSGLYFAKVITDYGTSSIKLVKK